MVTHFSRSRAFTPAVGPLFAFFVAVAALGVAYASEVFYGLHPCHMCIWQRIPYAVIIVLALLAFFVRGRAKIFWKLLLWLCVLALLVNVGLSVFHAGVEWKWWEGPATCTGGFDGLSAEDILAKIQGAPTVSCGEAAIRILGLSMAGWNAIYAAGAAIALGRIIGKSK